MIDWLPHMFGSHVNCMTFVDAHHIFYKPSVITEAIAVSRLLEGSKVVKSCNINGYLYAVSNDCHLSVFDLESGNCIGHLQTGITGNLGVAYCFERIFVCNRENHIISLIRSSNKGTPVPEIDSALDPVQVDAKPTQIFVRWDKFDHLLPCPKGL